MKIGTLEVGGSAPCAVIAELGNAHNGKLSTAQRLLDAAKAAGASAAKLQCYTPDELIALRGDGTPPAPWDHMTMRDLYAQAMTPREWFAPLYEYAASIDLPIFSSVFGLESLALLESIGNQCYKLAALDIEARWLADAVCATRKPVIVSAAGDFRYRPNTMALFCPPGYPQRAFGLWAGSFRDMDRDYPVYDGFSYHGTDPRPCLVAATLGAKIIECHVQLDDEPSDLEANVSLTMSDLAHLVREIRATEAILGT